jgi:16S rRNA (adenine1518-N6/adenine1519-N6)-dimethyltransferase
MRRKTLRNALRPMGDPDRSARAADDARIDLGRRGETLSVEEFGRLAACWDALA